MDHRNPQLAMLNLAAHGIDQPLVRASDPGALFRSLGNGMADFVLCNPPFNQRVQGLEHLGWPFGLPPSRTRTSPGSNSPGPGSATRARLP